MAFVLIDFFNAYTAMPPVGVLAFEIGETVEQILLDSPDTRWFQFRYYGGWFEDGNLTARASELMGLLATADPFPRPYGPDRRVFLRGEFRLADRLLAAPQFELGDTLRSRDGLPRLRLSMSQEHLRCPVPGESCAMKRVAKLTKSPRRTCWIDRCPETVATAFSMREQKMVDTMMTCDLLHITHSGLGETVVVETNDTDILPGLAQAATLTASRLIIRTRGHSWQRPRVEPLVSLGVRLVESATDA